MEALRVDLVDDQGPAASPGPALRASGLLGLPPSGLGGLKRTKLRLQFVAVLEQLLERVHELPARAALAHGPIDRVLDPPSTKAAAASERVGCPFKPPTAPGEGARLSSLAWQFGWDELVAAVAATYQAMPPEEQARVAIIGNNYGDSGAVDLLGPKYGLTLKALGTHQSYWLWGPGDTTKDVFIVLGDRPEGLRKWCEDVEVAAELSHPWTAVWENRPILVCRRRGCPSPRCGGGRGTGAKGGSPLPSTAT